MNAMNREIALEDAMPATPVQTGAYVAWLKRPLDIALVLLSLPFTVPLIAIMALLVARNGGQPFFRQARVGRHGKIYTMWKIRTMVAQAEAALEAHLAANPEMQSEWAEHQKLQDDPRVTKLGARLRACSMDELPQIWNVLTGDMSLIGPRPMLPNQTVLYRNPSYFSMRPGITGLWQVSRRNDVSFSQRARIDAVYCGKVTFQSDLRILLRTISVVLGRTGV